MNVYKTEEVCSFTFVCMWFFVFFFNNLSLYSENSNTKIKKIPPQKKTNKKTPCIQMFITSLFIIAKLGSTSMSFDRYG